METINSMSRTTTANDQILAISGYLRAKHVAMLLNTNPKTVLKRYPTIEHLSTKYVLWDSVLESLDPQVAIVLKLPVKAAEALHMARKEKLASVAIPEAFEPNVVAKANDAIEKVKFFLKPKEPKPVVVSDEPPPPLPSAPVSTTSQDDEGPILTLKPKPVVKDFIPVIEPANRCKNCPHGLDPFHKEGICSFGRGTVAQCSCLGS
jgi:hypothetical protein